MVCAHILGCRQDPGADVQTSVLEGPEGLRPRLSYYRPGLHQREHIHHSPHLSIVVAGSFQEVTRRSDRLICQGTIGFRADSARHAVHYGPAGALILSVDTGSWISSGPGRDGIRWLPVPARAAHDLLGSGHSGPPVAAATILQQLLALAADRPPTRTSAASPAPAWLRAASERLIAAPRQLTIGELSRWCGVHRTHLARAFVCHYGMTPSLFRRRAMVAQSLACALGLDSSLAGAAASAGFADQSHMTRAVRESCGLTPGRVRDLLRSATYVQDPADRPA